MRYAERNSELAYLATELKNGSESAFNEIYMLSAGQLERYGAARLTNDQYMLQDALQETFMTILEKIDKLNDPASFMAWAFTILRNKVNDEYRKTKRIALMDQNESRDDCISFFSVLADERLENMPEEKTVRDELVDEVGAVIRNLPPEQGFSLMAHVYDGMKMSEIAYIMDCPEGTVKSRINKARKTIREHIEKRV